MLAYDVAIESADHVTAARSAGQAPRDGADGRRTRLRWTVGIVDAFEATMAGRLEEAEWIATANLELGMQIGAPDAFTFFAGQFFVIGTFAGRHDELFPLVEQVAKDNPLAIAFKLAYGIICRAVGREDVAREILDDGMASGFAELPVDNIWTTCVIGYAILAIELDHAEAAAQLLPLIEPFANDVAFNGVTSQGPIAAYVGKLASLLGRHDDAEEHLRVALDIADGVRMAVPPGHHALRARAGKASPARPARRRSDRRGSPRRPSCAGRWASGPGSPESTSWPRRSVRIGVSRSPRTIWSRTDWSGSIGASSVGSSRTRPNARSMNGPSITGL